MNAAALEQAVSFLNSWLNYRFRQTDIPGLSVAVACHGDIHFAHTYGLADIEHQEVLRADHLFGVASQTKMFTAIAIMQLVQASKIDLDRLVNAYLPWLNSHPSEQMKVITIRQLLAHSAGLARDLPEADFWHLTKPFPDTAGLRNAIYDTPIIIEPNTKLKYSNAGYALLGQVIEAVSGQSYSAYVTDHIIRRLNLLSTFADYSLALATRTTTGYGVPYGQQRMPFRERLPTNALAAAAGIHTTAEDMCRFADALCMGNESLVSDLSKKEIHRSQWVQTTGYDAGLELGLGFEALTVGRRRIVGHSGHIAGHLSATYFDPQDRLVVSVLANSKHAPSPKIAMSIIEILDYFAAYGSKPVSAALARFNARLFSPIATVEIVATADKIIAINPNDWQPLAFYEELERVDAHTLRLVTEGSIFNEGELVCYSFKQNTVTSVTYAGSTLLPEQVYQRTWLPHHS